MQIVKCPHPLSSKARRMIEEQDIVNENLARAKRKRKEVADSTKMKHIGNKNAESNHVITTIMIMKVVINVAPKKIKIKDLLG